MMAMMCLLARMGLADIGRRLWGAAHVQGGMLQDAGRPKV